MYIHRHTQKNLPPKIASAPKSGRNVFFSLKFLKILTVDAFSRTAYSEESAAQTNSWAEPKLLLRKAIAV